MYKNFTLISVDRVFLLLKAHFLGMTWGVLYSRNVASFIFVDVINPLEITTGFTILIAVKFLQCQQPYKTKDLIILNKSNS